MEKKQFQIRGYVSHIGEKGKVYINYFDKGDFYKLNSEIIVPIGGFKAFNTTGIIISKNVELVLEEYIGRIVDVMFEVYRYNFIVVKDDSDKKIYGIGFRLKSIEPV